jgi:hypothetical protein
MIFYEIVISFSLFMIILVGLVVLLDRWIGIEHIGSEKKYNLTGKGK